MDDSGLQALAHAIVIQAVDDYIKGVCNCYTEDYLENIKRFFRSPLFELYAPNLDCEAVIEVAQQRGEYKRFKKDMCCNMCKDRFCVHRTGDKFTEEWVCRKREQNGNQNTRGIKH